MYTNLLNESLERIALLQRRGLRHGRCGRVEGDHRQLGEGVAGSACGSCEAVEEIF